MLGLATGRFRNWFPKYSPSIDESPEVAYTDHFGSLDSAVLRLGKMDCEVAEAGHKDVKMP
jgi:hypothetical protein